MLKTTGKPGCGRCSRCWVFNMTVNTGIQIVKKPSRSANRAGRGATWLTVIALLAFFVCIYSLTYSGAFSADDEHILAAQSLSLAFDRQFNISRVIGNSRVFALSQLAPRQAGEAANVEPAQALIGALLAKLAVLLGVGRVQAMYLLNLWATAGTAGVVFLAAVQRGHTRRTGLILAGIFGLGTIAFPYARTYFRDPLAMLFLACAWLCARRIAARTAEASGGSRQRMLAWLGFSAFCLAGMLAKNTVVIAIPVMLLEILLSNVKNKKIKPSNALWKKIVIGLGALGGIVLLWFLVTPRIPILARYTPAYYASLVKFFFTTPRPHFLQALAGPFISAGKSLFLFSPVLVLALWSLVFHFREAWSAWLYLLLLVIFQALFYDDAWAQLINWGLRFVLPAIPPLVMASAVTIERLLKSRKGQVLLVLLMILSVCVQLLGVVTPVNQYVLEKYTAVPQITEQTLIWQGRHSILWWSLSGLLQRKSIDLALWRNEDAAGWVLPAALMVVLLAAAGLRFGKIRWGAVVSLALVMALNIGMLLLYRNDPEYSRTRSDLQQSQEYLAAQVQPQDRVLILSYGASAWKYWMNWDGARPEWTALPYYFPTPEQIEQARQTGRPEDALSPITLTIFSREITAGQKVWLLLPDDSPGANLGFEQAWLGQRATDSGCRTFTDSPIHTTLCWYLIEGQEKSENTDLEEMAVFLPR